jgi:hypothetical protein
MESPVIWDKMLYNLLKVCVLPPFSVFFDHENRSDMFLWNDCLPTDYMILHPKLLLEPEILYGDITHCLWEAIHGPHSYILESRKKLYCCGNTLAQLVVLVQLYLIKYGVTLLPQSSCAPCPEYCLFLTWTPPWGDACYSKQWSERGILQKNASSEACHDDNNACGQLFDSLMYASDGHCQ